MSQVEQLAANRAERIAVVGQGYVGLPLTLAFGEAFQDVVAFDIDEAKIARLKRGIDHTGEADEAKLTATTVKFTADQADLDGCTFFVVAVPTPIDELNRPDLRILASASRIVGQALARGAVVVYESTVYPGVTEEFCAPILAKESGLASGSGFALGYSPERINPGDKEHTLTSIVKVVAGQDPATLDRIAAVYGAVVSAGVYRASSIKVAEAAKVIENTQRDLNIALMNELAMIFDRIGIDTLEVLEAAGTKWNFLPFRPGLVGGHCIGVDPYYLTTKAQEVGYDPQVILAGRRINDGMGTFVAQKTVKLLATSGLPVNDARVGVLGLTFKENVPDLRNSRVPDILAELAEYSITPLVHDSMADPGEALHEYGVELADLDEFRALDALVIAVAHRGYRERVLERLPSMLKAGGVVVDVKSLLKGASLPPSVRYWSL